MKTLLTVALLVMALQHTEPPKGWLCNNKPKTPTDHQCACHRTCEYDPETMKVVEKEDPGCKVWCYRDHCACLNECDSH